MLETEFAVLMSRVGLSNAEFLAYFSLHVQKGD